MHYTLKIKEYPNNEVRATIYRVQAGRSLGDCDDAGSDEADGNFDSNSGTSSDPCTESSLDITSKLSRDRPPGYGGIPKKTRFGNNARRTISRCAGVFERDGILREECLFLTGTIPGSTGEAFDAMACWSSWVVKSVKTWLSNLGVSDNYSAYVWEFQDRGALHLHYLVLVKDPIIRLKVLWKWAIKWGQLIDKVGSLAGVDMWKKNENWSWKNQKSVLQAAAQYVHKSVGSYLSKYLSKNVDGRGKNIVGQSLSPVRWWGCSRPLLQRMRELTDGFEVEVVGPKAVRSVWGKVIDGFRGVASGFHEYSDKLGFARVAVAFDVDGDSTFNQLWRDLRCEKNHGNVGRCSTEWQPLPGLPEMRISGRTSQPNSRGSMRRFAARIRASVCLVLICGLVPKQSRMQLMNIERKKIPRQLMIPTLTSISN